MINFPDPYSQIHIVPGFTGLSVNENYKGSRTQIGRTILFIYWVLNNPVPCSGRSISGTKKRVKIPLNNHVTGLATV